MSGMAAVTVANSAAEAADMAGKGRIDFHHHVVPPVYRQMLATIGVADVGRVPLPEWTPEQMLRNMDTLGIAKALVSVSSPGVYFGDVKFAADLATRSNDAIVQLRTTYPTRVGGFGSLPLPDVDKSLAEYERIRTKLKLDGVILLTNYGGKYLGHADYAPLLSELNRQKALVFVHPHLPPGVDNLNLTLPPPILEFVFDTTRTIGDMVFTGLFDRYPNIRWVISHLGGALPFIAWRLSLVEASPRGAYAAFRERGRTVQDYLKTLYYDTAVSAAPGSLKATLELVGSDRIVFGSDIPHAPFNFVQSTTANLDAFTGLDAAAHHAIASGNASRLLGS
jgi:predicted TIM-barrel fold metal-dependent hydrolase